MATPMATVLAGGVIVYQEYNADYAHLNTCDSAAYVWHCLQLLPRDVEDLSSETRK